MANEIVTQHTPGPWGYTATHVGPQVMVYRIQSESVPVRIVEFSGYRAESNARLIAAAPDLLTTLRNLVELVESRAPEASGWPDVESARAAIAKAEGRE